MAAVDFQVIRRTPLANGGGVIFTIKQADTDIYATFIIASTSSGAQRLNRYRTKEAALRQHQRLVEKLNSKHKG